jgi:IS30 family transposase
MLGHPLNFLAGYRGRFLQCDSHIATLVERRSRFVMLVQVGGKDSER